MQIDRFLLDLNHFDGQLARFPPADAVPVLDAAIRSHCAKHGIKRTAAILYRRADMLAVRGIEDAPEEQLHDALVKMVKETPSPEAKPDFRWKHRLFWFWVGSMATFVTSALMRAYL